MTKIIITAQEMQWIAQHRITRSTDGQEVLIYPMGAERYLFRVLQGLVNDRYPIKADIIDKNVLVIPGFATSGLLFAQAGAKSVTVYDKDPVTIAWVKAYKKYYHYRQGSNYPSVGELLAALTDWFPPLISLPTGNAFNYIRRFIAPKSLRRIYLQYLLQIIQEAVQSKDQENYELDKNISFHAGELKHLLKEQQNTTFDTAFIPYLLGVTNGIENEKEIGAFISELLPIIPKGRVIITPSQGSKEFGIVGQRYFTTTRYDSISAIPDLHKYLIQEDPHWFQTQGLAVFSVDAKMK